VTEVAIILVVVEAFVVVWKAGKPVSGATVATPFTRLYFAYPCLLSSSTMGDQ
jgi:hypothetical protein